ncbi:heavy metal-binding domain-containing protein [Verrucomicrobiota bacterium sgz303538]
MSPLSRSWNAILPTTALILAFAGYTPTLLADGKHSASGAAAEHAHSDAPHSSPSKLNSPGEAWAVIQSSVSRIQELTAAKALKEIHSVEENVEAALKYLQNNSPMVTGDKQKRLASALNQALTFAGNVHTASDAGDQSKTEAELKKLQAGLKLVAAQYPADALQPPPGFVKYQCPMKDFTGDKPGDCPTCGMALKPVLAAAEGEHNHGDHNGGHGHGAAAATLTLAATSAKPLTVGQKADVTVTLTKKDGTPVLTDDLKEAHTEKLHLLIIDPSLTDYHHEHPTPTGTPGEYVFSFTPKKPGSYRIWADVTPTATGQQEYVITDLAAATKPEPVGNRAERLSNILEGLNYTLTFKEPLKAGEASLGTLTVKNAKGEVISNLEPLMGAYAHIVGFSHDFKTIAHIHPMGEEPTKPTDRGRGELQFHLMPEQPGMLMLFAQVQIGGQSKFVPFTLNIQPGETERAGGTAAR